MAMFRLYVDGCLSVMKNQTIGRRGRRDAEERQQQRKAKCCVFLIFSAPLRLCGERFYSFLKKSTHNLNIAYLVVITTKQNDQYAYLK
jgi:hypothetical protein